MRNNYNNIKHIALILSIVALTACGGSSNNDNEEVTPPVTPPVAPVNNAPVISSTALTEAAEGSAYSYTFAGTDADSGDTLTLAAPTLPSWLSFDASTGVLSQIQQDSG